MVTIPSKDCVLVVQPGGGAHRYKELGPVRVRSGVSHTHSIRSKQKNTHLLTIFESYSKLF